MNSIELRFLTVLRLLIRVKFECLKFGAKNLKNVFSKKHFKNFKNNTKQFKMVVNGTQLEETEEIMKDIIKMYNNPQDIAIAQNLVQNRKDVTATYERRHKALQSTIKGQ